jgi:hypothetical protein
MMRHGGKNAEKPKHKFALPEEANQWERAVALARRLYTCKTSKGVTVCTLPNWLLGPIPESSRAEELLWAAIGRKLALKEPEFSPGRGRKKGSKDRQRRAENQENSNQNIIRRRYRDKKSDEQARNAEKAHALRELSALIERIAAPPTDNVVALGAAR